MNIVIPPVPDRYNMVDLHGTDLAKANGHKVIGLYNAISDALDEDKIEMFYNWRFADIIIPPAYVVVDDNTLGEFIINEEILVTSDDTISIIGTSRPPIINSLTITANGTYVAPSGVDGYSPVIVEVPETPPPILVSLSATQNGHYLPGVNEDGFSDVTVDVPPPVLVSLNATENGTYVPALGQDGFSEVNVNLSIPQPYDNNPAEDGVASPGVSSQWSRGDHVHPHDTSKLDINGDGSNITAVFTTAANRINISTGEKLSIIFGKISKWFADIGSAAFRGVDVTPIANSTNLVQSGGVLSSLLEKSNVIAATTGASGITLESPSSFCILMASRGDNASTFALVYKYNNWFIAGDNHAGITIDASTGDLSILNYTRYKIIY